MRYFIELCYDGTPYHGWQNQPNAISIQQIVEQALTTLLRQKTAIVGAGRTDAGVHAKQLYAHMDVAILPKDFLYRLNSYLPPEIAVNAIHQVEPKAHARFDATARSYEYLINKKKNPFLQNKAYFFSVPLNLDLMNTASKELLGYKDFKCFSRTKTDVKTYYCNITQATWSETDMLIKFNITADRFLRNMVRAIVGTLLNIGQGKMSLDKFRQIITEKDRSKAGASAPAHGLYLNSIRYPNNIFLDGRN